MRNLLIFLLFALLLTANAQSGQFNPRTNDLEKSKLYKADVLWWKGDSIYFSNLRSKNNTISKEQARLADSYFKKALKKNPNHAPSMNGLGLTCFSTKKYDEAIVYFSKAIELDSHSMCYNNRAMVYSVLCQYKLAIADYKESIKRDSNNYITYHNLGCMHDQLKEYDLSISYYTKALTLNPNFLLALSDRGGAKLLARQYSEALVDFNASIAIDSLNKSTMNGRGLIKYYLGLYQEAIIDFQKVQKCPIYDNGFIDVYAYNNMANCYFALGQNKKACEFWKKALNNGYKYEAEWKELYKIDDPNVLLLKHCR